MFYLTMNEQQYSVSILYYYSYSLFRRILDIRQVAALNFSTFWWWFAYVHISVFCCTCVAYVCAYAREKVMFQVYGGESESISDQYRFLFCFQPFIKHTAFRRMTASMLAFLVFYHVTLQHIQFPAEMAKATLHRSRRLFKSTGNMLRLLNVVLLGDDEFSYILDISPFLPFRFQVKY